MDKYSIGLDFGTLSVRAVLVNVSDGHVLASAEYAYPHGVMEGHMPSGAALKKGWALQHPGDYLSGLGEVIPRVMQASGVQPEAVAGIGLDFTASTTLPVTGDGTPLCFLPEFAHHPHAYVKLWKHHGAQAQADQMTRVALERNEPWLSRYGGKVSCEWAFPKLLELLEEAPEVYEAMDEWVEAGDWIVRRLTGVSIRGLSGAGYKSFYDRRTGYPDPDYFAALDPRLRDVMKTRYRSPVVPIGQRAGTLTRAAAQALGLPEGTPVAVANVDGPVSAPAVGFLHAGQMLAIIGTSTGHFALTEHTLRTVSGMCGAVEGGVLPGLFCYESGQNCVGDMFAWFADACVPPRCAEEAKKSGLSVQQYLTALAASLRPGESGLLALDWWNGNRSVLVDSDLSGLILGLTLRSKPEEIYRALLEATAFGTRMIAENYREYGVPINELIATGGISQKSPLMMQIYADVLNLPIYVAEAAQGPALGSALFGAVAAGKSGRGHDTIFDAAEKMGCKKMKTYRPNSENVRVYEQLFAEYKRLHDFFGRGGADTMKHLRAIAK